MSIIDNLITDRTQDDVDRVAELKSKIYSGGVSSLTTDEYTEYFSGMRGAYNATDLNRVGEACNYVYALLNNVGRRPAGYAIQKTNWTISDIPKRTDMTTYITNIMMLRSALAISIPVPGSMDNLTYEGANRIERMLVEAIKLVQGYENAMYFCGELYLGEITN